MLDFWRNTKIVSHPKRDWQALERKMGAGMSLEDAADACGIPQPEASEWAKTQLEDVSPTRVQLNAVAESALATAIEKLEAIVAEGPRFSSTEYSEEGKPVKSVTPQNTDLDAAKALATLAISALKVAGTAKGPAATVPPRGGKLSVQLDLWDSPGNWQLTKPE